MRWNREERQAIEEQIKIYKKKIANTRCKGRCIFCEIFLSYSDDDCPECPNNTINSILNIAHTAIGYNRCVNNMCYFISKFALDKTKRFNGFCKNMQQLTFRKKMWEDSLSLNKKEFIRKYKEA